MPFHHRLVFLDIDGCLNDHGFDPDVLCGRIDTDKVQRLNRILRATDAKIVLSSAWRYIIFRREATLSGMEWLLRSHGVLAGRLIGATWPDTMRRVVYNGNPATWPIANERGEQIATWLRLNPWYNAHVVIDDLDLGISAAGHPFVQTDGKIGLTDDDAERAIEMLTERTVI